jgi:hypothetical protein
MRTCERNYRESVINHDCLPQQVRYNKLSVGLYQKNFYMTPVAASSELS